MSSPSAPLPAPGPASVHPAIRAARRVSEELKGIADLDPGFMSTTDKAAALLAWTDVSTRVEAERLRLLAAGGDVAQQHGSRDVAAWLAHRRRLGRAETRRDLRLAEALDRRWQVLATALAEAEVNLAQARAVAQALDELPADLDAAVRERAEAHLVAQAAEFGPRELRVLGRKVLEVVAPEVADEHERKKVEAEERAARVRTSLRMQHSATGPRSSGRASRTPRPAGCAPTWRPTPRPGASRSGR